MRNYFQVLSNHEPQLSQEVNLEAKNLGEAPLAEAGVLGCLFI